MTHNEFNQLRHTVAALPPEQLRQLRDDIDRELAEAAARPGRGLPEAVQDAAEESNETVEQAKGRQQATDAAAPARRKRIWEFAEDIRRSVPAEEWAKLPVDGAEQHDHYIYGTPKRPSAQ